jgi:hypothetical protein
MQEENEAGIILRSPDTLTLDELRELSTLLNDFIVKAEITTAVQNAKATGDWMNLFAEIPASIFKNDESFQAFVKLASFICNSDISEKVGSELMDLFSHALNFIHEVDIMSFLQQITTTFSRLIKE